ncbi:hypothetical protein MHU86_114 [Fragilaria crotonensis]|nr:hypothetical protein MHU86_114 [Fragilaria crotonensis]
MATPFLLEDAEGFPFGRFVAFVVSNNSCVEFFTSLPSVEYESTETSVSYSTVTSAISKATFPSQSKDTAIPFSPDEKCWGHHVQLLEDWGPAVPRSSLEYSQPEKTNAPDRTEASIPAFAFSSPSSSDTSGWGSPLEAMDEDLDSSMLFLVVPSVDVVDPPVETSQSKNALTSKAPNAGAHSIATQGLQPLLPFNAATRLDTPLTRAKVLHPHSRNHSEPVLSVAALTQKNFDYRPSMRTRPLPTGRIPFQQPLIGEAVDQDSFESAIPAGATVSIPVKDDTFPPLRSGPISDWSAPASLWYNGHQSQDLQAEQTANEATLSHRVEFGTSKRDPNLPDHSVYLEQIDPKSKSATIPREKIRTSNDENSGSGAALANPQKSFSRLASSGMSSAVRRGSVDGLVSLDSQATSRWDPDGIATSAATPVASNRYAQHLGFLQTLVQEAKLSK